MPSPYETLKESLTRDLSNIADAAATGRLTPVTFLEVMEEALGDHHIAVAMQQAGVTRLSDIPPRALQKLEDVIDFHVGKAQGFARDFEQAGEWRGAWDNRAKMYAGSLDTTRGIMAGAVGGGYVDLPAQPGQGSPCLTNCGCEWETIEVDAELGHYDYFWRLDTSLENCSVCQKRRNDWNPLQVRFGEIT